MLKQHFLTADDASRVATICFLDVSGLGVGKPLIHVAGQLAIADKLMTLGPKVVERIQQVLDDVNRYTIVRMDEQEKNDVNEQLQKISEKLHIK